MSDVTTRNFKAIAARLRALEAMVKNAVNTQGGGYWIPFGRFIDNLPLTTTAQQPFIMTIPRDMRILKIACASYVATTNTGANYWTAVFSTAAGTVGSFNTSTFTADTWTPISITSFSLQDVTTVDDTYIVVTVTKTGTPGGFYLASPSLFFV